jgi:PAS domain S-box-containing protein
MVPRMDGGGFAQGTQAGGGTVPKHGGRVADHLAILTRATCPLGAVRDWPVALRLTVSTILPADVPIALFWGPDYLALYNDAYAPTVGDRHPRVLCRPAREGWAELWDDLEPMLARVRDTGETFSDKDRALYIERHGPGEVAYFDISYSAVRDERGMVAGVMCIVTETTDRVRAEERLLLSTESLRLATEAAEIGIWDFDLGTDTLTWSDRTKAMFGLPPSAPVSMADFQAGLHPDDLEGTMAAFQAALDPARRAAYDVEYRTIGARDGVVRWIAARGRGIFDADGRCVRALGTTIDVTARKQAAATLRESEARFRLLADSAPALMWITDTQGWITFANRWFETMIDMSPEQVLRDGMRDLVHPDDRDRVTAERMRAYVDRSPWSADVRMVDRTGAERWIHSEGLPRFLDGEFAGYVACAVDVTDAHVAAEALERRIAERTGELERSNDDLVAQIAERERVEATLHQMQRLEAIGQLTSGVAHDFNNLLTVVLGNAGLVERAARQADLDDRTIQRIDNIRTAAQRGAALTQQLLAFSRRQRLDTRVLDLNATAAGMRGLLEGALGNAVTVDLDPGRDLWPALVDATQVELAILNLAINARDAMAVGGIVSIRTANVRRPDPTRPEHPPAGDHVAISVTDTGSGMTDEVRARVFEPFFTTKAVGKGSGLGLAQVFGFAKQSGGGLAIETAPGRGTTVTVFFPRARASAPDTEPASDASDADLGNATILLVDDDDAVRAVTETMIVDMGATVFSAPDGATALRCLRDRPEIDLVIADFAMPGMNGAALAKRVAAERPDTPLLMLTGYADLGAIADVAEDAIIQKPVTPEALRARIATALGRPG